MLPIVDRNVPDDLAVGAVERHQPRIEPGDNDEIARERHATTDWPAAQHGVEAVAIFRLVMPEDIAGLRVYSEGASVVSGEIEDAVAEEGRRFETTELPARGHRPHGRELRGVVRSDFRQWAKAPVAVVAAISQPFLGIVLRLDEIVGSHGVGACGPGRRDHRKDRYHQHAFHDFALPALSMDPSRRSRCGIRTAHLTHGENGPASTGYFPDSGTIIR